MADLHAVLSRLEKVKPSGEDRWMACCPAHADSNPSLMISINEKGEIWPHCYAGCTQKAVMDALGMPLQVNGKPNPKADIALNVIKIAQAQPSLTPAQQAEFEEAKETIKSTDLVKATALRLSELDSIDYEQLRVDEAKALNIRVSFLDKLIKDLRTEPDQNVIEELNPWHDAVDGKALFTDLVSIITSYVSVENGAAEAIALWCMGTYCYDSFPIFPKLLVTSPEMRCGKSTLLTEVVGALCHKALPASGIAAATIFRAIELWKPTLLIDEADTFVKGDELMRGVINSTHLKSGARIIRCDGEDNIPRAFSTWAPLALAMIQNPPSTIIDRSIHVRMRRKTLQETLTKVPLSFLNRMQHIRRKLIRWALDNTEGLLETPPMPSSSNDRLLDNWLPLFTIANLIDRLEHAARSWELISEPDESEEVGPMLLSDIRQVFRGKHMRSSELLEALIDLEDRPWSEWRRGKPMIASSLAKILKPYKICPHQQRMYGENRNGYNLDDFQDAFERYLHPATNDAGSEEKSIGI